MGREVGARGDRGSDFPSVHSLSSERAGQDLAHRPKFSTADWSGRSFRIFWPHRIFSFLVHSLSISACTFLAIHHAAAHNLLLHRIEQWCGPFNSNGLAYLADGLRP